MSLCPPEVIHKVDAPYVEAVYLLRVCDAVWRAEAELELITPEVLALAKGPRIAEDETVLWDWLMEIGCSEDDFKRRWTGQTATNSNRFSYYAPMRGMTITAAASVIASVAEAHAAGVQGVEHRGRPVCNTNRIVGFTVAE